MTTPDPSLAIDVKNLCKSFAGKRVVDNVELQVQTGRIFGFLGPNGSGKTTTLRMICGLLIPDAGSGTCLGYDIIHQAREIKQRVGYMTQHFSLYQDLSVYENLDFVGRLYGIANRKARIAETLVHYDFTGDRANQLAGTLSGGWKQRLSLAAVTLPSPKLLLLDEPTAGVDPKARRDFWDEIHRLASTGITTLVTTHYMDEAERCHRLAYLSNGKLLTRGTIDEVIAHAHLTTWEVRGENLQALSDDLESLPDVEQVASFGLVLHVSGSEEAALERAIAPYRTAIYQWRPIASSLEDVFIRFMGEAEGKAGIGSSGKSAPPSP